MKRSAGNNFISTPPYVKNLKMNTNNPNYNNKISTLLEQINSASQGVTEMLEQEGVSPAVKSAFGTFSALLGTCRAIIDSLQQQNNTIVSAEEQERKRSLVVIGVPESTKPKPSERATDDKNTITELLDELGVEATPTSTYRLGKPDPNRRGPRLIKVVLPASVYQHIALGGWKRHRTRLRTTPLWSRTIVRPSLSPQQLQEERDRRAAARQDESQSNLNRPQSHPQ